MASQLVIGINIFGIIVSLFSIYVTYSLYTKYKLENSLFFVVTSIAVTIWNVLHLILNFIEPSDTPFYIIRIIWLIVVYAGIIFVFAFIFGFSRLRYEDINWRLLIYTGVGTAFILLFTLQEEWVNVSYTISEGWTTRVYNETFWSIFSISVFAATFIEIIIPLVNTYARTEKDKDILLVMLVGILLSVFSNALEPMLRDIGFPQAFRFLVADLGFLIFFIILLKYPFTGLYDNSMLYQVIVANSSGVPSLILSENQQKAILTSGALISINSILEEITATTQHLKGEELTRKIQLGFHQFFIVIRGNFVVIFQFKNPTGVAFSKFKSLGRIISLKDTTQKLPKDVADTFQNRVVEYFSDFSPASDEQTQSIDIYL